MSGTLGLEQAILGHTLAFAPMVAPAQVYVALDLAPPAAPPSEAAPGTEATGAGYTRMPATFALIATPANIAANTAVIEFPMAGAAWGTVGYFELWDAAVGGNRLYWGQLIDPATELPITITVGSGDILRFSPGALAVQAATGTGGTGTVGAYLPLGGGTLTGPLLLAADPTTYLQAATKQYVDAHSGDGGGPGFLPLSGGIMLGALTLSGNAVNPLHAVPLQQVLPISGGALTGPLTLAADPTAALGSATKQYVDGAVTRAGGPFLALAGGTLTGALVLAADPASPTQAATKNYVDTTISALGPYLPLAGGTLTGALTLSGNAVNPLHAVPLQQLNATVAGGPFLPLTGGTVTGPLNVTATGGNTVRSVQNRFADVVNVKDYGATGAGAVSDTAAIQAAAAAIPASGGTLYIPAGTYLTTGRVTLNSNTQVRGAGPGTVLLGGSAWSAGGGFFINQNSAATTLTDSNIVIRDLTLDFGTSGKAGSIHAIDLIYVQGVKVLNVVIQCRGAGDAVALQGCYDTLISGCSAYGFINCAYDHWAAPRKGRVVSCYAETASSAQIVNWNPEFTTGSSAGNVAEGFVLASCTLVCTGSNAIPIQVEPLGSGTFVTNVVVQGNTFNNVRIAARGATTGVVVEGNVFDALVGGHEAVTSYAQNGGTPTNIVVSGNIVNNPDTSSGNVGVIRVQCDSGVVIGNTISGASYAAASIATSTNVPIVFGNNAAVAAATPNASSGLPPAITALNGFTAGSNTVNINPLQINGVAGGNRPIMWRTAGVQRWNIQMTGAAESGSNVGCDMVFLPYSDAGANLGNAMTITRSTGQVNALKGLAVTGNAGFNGTAPIAKPTVSGAKGSNAALASLMTALAAYGLVTDSTSA